MDSLAFYLFLLPPSQKISMPDDLTLPALPSECSLPLPSREPCG